VDIVILESALKHDGITVDSIVNEVIAAEEHGKLRNATKQETMRVRLAALSAIVRKMQEIVENDRELVNA
jgi:hypothetical protein